MAEGIVCVIRLRNRQDAVGECIVAVLAILQQSTMETLSEILGRLNDPVLASRADKKGRLASKGLVTMIELLSREEHLLLAKDRQLVGSQGVVIGSEEGVLSGKGF